MGRFKQMQITFMNSDDGPLVEKRLPCTPDGDCCEFAYELGTAPYCVCSCHNEPEPKEILGRTNGHTWIEFEHFQVCQTCGTIRNVKDDNKLCKGNVRMRDPEIDLF